MRSQTGANSCVFKGCLQNHCRRPSRHGRSCLWSVSTICSKPLYAYIVMLLLPVEEVHMSVIHDILYCTCRAKVDLPLVSPGQFKAPSRQDTLCKSLEQASARIADREQPYLANVPLLQQSYLFGVADWYSLVMTLLNSHWETICSAYSPAKQTADALNKAPLASDLASEQDLGCDWMSWGWLQSFFKGLNAQHRQVLGHCLHLSILQHLCCPASASISQPSSAWEAYHTSNSQRHQHHTRQQLQSEAL